MRYLQTTQQRCKYQYIDLWTKTEKRWLLWAKIYILHHQIYKGICRRYGEHNGELNRYLQ